MSVKIEQLVVEARKRAIGPRWGFEMAQPVKAMHGIDIEREIACAVHPVTGPKYYSRQDDEGRSILRRLFG